MRPTEHEHTYAFKCETSEAAERLTKKIKADCAAKKSTVIESFQNDNSATYMVRSSEHYDRMRLVGITVRKLQRNEIELFKEGMRFRCLEQKVAALEEENTRLKKRGDGYISIAEVKKAAKDIGELLDIQCEYADANGLKDYFGRISDRILEMTTVQPAGEKSTLEQRAYNERIATLEKELAAKAEELSGITEDYAAQQREIKILRQNSQNHSESDRDFRIQIEELKKSAASAQKRIISLQEMKAAADAAHADREEKYISELDSAKTSYDQRLAEARDKITVYEAEIKHLKEHPAAADGELSQSKEPISAREERILIPDPDAETTATLFGYIAFKRIMPDDIGYVESAFDRQCISYHKNTGKVGATKVYQFGHIDAALEAVVDSLQQHAGTMRPRERMIEEIRAYFSAGEQCGCNPAFWKPNETIDFLTLVLGARITTRTVQQKLNDNMLSPTSNPASMLRGVFNFDSSYLQRPREVYKTA